ncbi:MAG: hypothetical protein JWN69_895 [Alphaproteobacteria bacterium]|nr:hypothetical protein [Alphaproteobacteria bacterium]
MRARGTARYPSYKSFDRFIDVEWLKSLDSYVTERIERRLTVARDLAFYTGPFVLETDASRLPGSRLIRLSESGKADNYYDLDRTDLWRPTPEAAEFSELTAFIDTLPFKATGRIIIIYDDSGGRVPAHRDHDDPDLCHEFIWFRTNLAKPFYMLEPKTGRKLYVESHAAWFDTVNQFHGADETGNLSFSIRVDGIFSDEFRNEIPYPSTNRSAAPALWETDGRAIADGSEG